MANTDTEVSATIQLLTLLLELRLSKRSPGTTPPPNGTGTIRDALLELVGDQVQVTNAFGVVSGTLLAVQEDYIIIIEDTGSQVLVPIEEIESVSGQ